MFFVKQLEEAYVQKTFTIEKTKEPAIVCVQGHKKDVLCSDGVSRFVVC